MSVESEVNLVVVLILKVLQNSLSLLSLVEKNELVTLELNRLGGEEGRNNSLRFKKIFFVWTAG